MNALAVSMAVAAGLAIDAALSQGMVGISRRPRDRARLAFAVASVAVAVGSLSVLAMYATDSPQRHAAIMKWLFFPSAVAWVVAAVWFVAFYTGVRPLRWLLVLTTGYGAVLALDFWLPMGLLHAEEGVMRSVQVAGSRVMLMEQASPHPLNVLTEILNLVAFAYLAYAVYRAGRGVNRRKAKNVALAAALFAPAAIVDTLTDYGVVTSLYTTQLCFAAVVVAASIALRRESLRTETELSAYRSHLESMVEARVRDLDMANEQLAQEVKERLAAEASLRRRVQELDGLQQVSQTLADSRDLAAALNEACGEIAALFMARFARAYLLDDETADGAEPAGPDGNAAGTVAMVAVSEVPLFKTAIDRRELVTVEDPDAALLPSDLADVVRSRDVSHLLLSPLVARGEAVGLLVIARDGLDPAFSSRETILARTVADTLAAVVENQRLHQRETRQAAEDERQRLARDLHDAVTQSIYSASLIAEALPAVWEREPSEGLENLVKLRRLVRAALAEMRTLLFELRPKALEAAPLGTLLERLGDSLSGQVQMSVEVDVSDEPDLPTEVKIALYRVAQEAFSNIAKHARAAHVSASLDTGDREVTLTVRDDGCGFDPEAVAHERMGLRIMRERLDRIGASLQVRGEPDEGTCIVAVWTRPDAARSEETRDRQRGDEALQYVGLEEEGQR